MLSAHRSRRWFVPAALTIALAGTAAPGLAAGHRHLTAAATNTAAAVEGPRLTLFSRVLNWSGMSWLVYAADQQGPENVPLSNSAQSVYVDSRGRLHLHIRKINGVWRSVELESLQQLHYGTYRMQVDTPTARFDKWTVLGMFVYRPGSKQLTNEIDIEDSRFPNLLQAPNNAQFAVQPYYKPHHEHHYALKKTYQHLRQQFTWLPGSGGRGTARFQTRLGTTAHSRLISRWTYHGHSVPTQQNMHLYLNLWTNHGKPPVNGTHSAIIDSFTYRPIV